MSSNNAPSSPQNSLEDNEHIMPTQDLLAASHQYNYQAAILNGMAMNGGHAKLLAVPSKKRGVTESVGLFVSYPTTPNQISAFTGTESKG